MKIRSCENCVFWKNSNCKSKSGKCTFKPYFFCYTLTPNLYPFTKKFYVCDKHKYENESVDEILQDRNDLTENVKNLDTYYNVNGFPIIRRCENCDFWKRDNNNYGHCTKLLYTFTFDETEKEIKNLYANTKEFFLCEDHILKNEKKLEAVSKKVKMKDIIKKKNEI